MKRIVCILLALLIVFGAAACDKNVKTGKTAELEGEKIFEIGDMYANFNEDDSEVTISTYKGSKKSVRIPDTVDGVPVCGVAAATFACTDINKVKFGKHIYFIEAYAFQETGIKKIEIPEGVTYLGDGVFYMCEDLKEVTLPESLITIGDDIFKDVPNNVTVNVVEGSKADEYCTELLSVGADITVKRTKSASSDKDGNGENAADKTNRQSDNE